MDIAILKKHTDIADLLRGAGGIAFSGILDKMEADSKSQAAKFLSGTGFSCSTFDDTNQEQKFLDKYGNDKLHRISKQCLGAIVGGEDEQCHSSDDGKPRATCGGTCFGVCADCAMPPNRYCMCFPRGYTGVSGTFYKGASCIVSGNIAGGGGTTVEAANSAGRKSYEL